MTPEITIPEEVTSLIQSAPGYLARTRAIASSDDYLLANEELAAIKLREKALREKYDWLLAPSKKGFQETKERLDETFKPGFEGLAAAKKAWDGAITNWRIEQKRIADEETRRRQAEVEKERARLREQARAEQAKADEAARKLQERAGAAGAAGKVAQAARLLEQADAKVMQAASRISVLETTAATMSAAPVEANIPKSDAGHGRKSWSGELAQPEELTEAEKQLAETPFEILICAIATGIWNKTNFPPADLLKLNETRLNKLAGPMFGVPGCRARCKETTVSARKK